VGDENRPICMRHDVLGDAAEQRRNEWPAVPRAEHDQVGVPEPRELDDLRGGIAFENLYVGLDTDVRSGPQRVVDRVVRALEPLAELALVEGVAEERTRRAPDVDKRRRRVAGTGEVEPLLDGLARAGGAVRGDEDPLHARSLPSDRGAGIRGSPDSRLRVSRAPIGGCPGVAALADADPEGMYARAIEESEARLHELRHAEWEGLGLAALFLASAFAASLLHPAFALPLLFGGLTGTALGVRAACRRWDLLDRITGERDAYAIAEVRARALEEATQERRHSLAISLRLILNAPGARINARVVGATEDLEALALDLDDDELVLDPAAAVACARLLTDPVNSPLLNPTAHAEDVRSRVRQIRSGFEVRHAAA
jgi:hypothetical protein